MFPTMFWQQHCLLHPARPSHPRSARQGLGAPTLLRAPRERPRCVSHSSGPGIAMGGRPPTGSRASSSSRPQQQQQQQRGALGKGGLLWSNVPPPAPAPYSSPPGPSGVCTVCTPHTWQPLQRSAQSPLMLCSPRPRLLSSRLGRGCMSSHQQQQQRRRCGQQPAARARAAPPPPHPPGVVRSCLGRPHKTSCRRGWRFPRPHPTLRCCQTPQPAPAAAARVCPTHCRLRQQLARQQAFC